MLMLILRNKSSWCWTLYSDMYNKFQQICHLHNNSFVVIFRPTKWGWHKVWQPYKCGWCICQCQQTNLPDAKQCTVTCMINSANTSFTQQVICCGIQANKMGSMATPMVWPMPMLNAVQWYVQYIQQICHLHNNSFVVWPMPMPMLRGTNCPDAKHCTVTCIINSENTLFTQELICCSIQMYKMPGVYVISLQNMLLIRTNSVCIFRSN